MEAFRWIAAILAPSYYLADITSAIDRPQAAALPLCPPMNRKATAKRLGIAVLIFLVAVSALAVVIYVGTCRAAQSVFTSREDLRLEIELYDSVCSSLFGDPIGSWDVSAVTDMSYLFSPDGVYGVLSRDFSLRTFNQDISAWNVSAVTDMSSMFYDADSFNQDISAWNVSAVTDMSSMFYDADSFNQDISAWNVSAVTDMSGMFDTATSFNQDVSAWNVSAVTDMSGMFYGAFSLSDCNRALIHASVDAQTNAWTYSWGSLCQPSSPPSLPTPPTSPPSAPPPPGTFDGKSALQTAVDLWCSDEAVALATYGHISGWDVSAITDMKCLFCGSTTGESTCNPDVSAWNVSAVRDMSHMFNYAASFNQDISAWNVSAVTTMRSMFSIAYSFNQDISAWNVSAVRDMTDMFTFASSFDKVLCSDAWRASKSKASQSWMFWGTNGAGICD